MSDSSSQNPLTPGLYFVATPLGNARDITLRALDVLRDADVLAAEDTRRLRQLMEIHAIPLGKRRIFAYHDANGAKARPGLLKALADGKSVAYASDAGSPLVADPGFVLAREAVAEGAIVQAIPGPSALVAALCVAALPTDRFTFAGFPPSAAGARRAFLTELAATRGTLVLYESPKRIAQTLADAAEVFGADRPAALARELTKKFEETRRATLAQLLVSCQETPPRGELVLLIDVAPPEANAEDVESALRAALKDNRLKDAARDVADRFGLSRRDLYQQALALKDDL